VTVALCKESAECGRRIAILSQLHVEPMGARTGILYRDMYSHNLVGAHVEMQSLAVRPAPLSLLPCQLLHYWTALAHLASHDRAGRPFLACG